MWQQLAEGWHRQPVIQTRSIHLGASLVLMCFILDSVLTGGGSEEDRDDDESEDFLLQNQLETDFFLFCFWSVLCSSASSRICTEYIEICWCVWLCSIAGPCICMYFSFHSLLPYPFHSLLHIHSLHASANIQYYVYQHGRLSDFKKRDHLPQLFWKLLPLQNFFICTHVSCFKIQIDVS